WETVDKTYPEKPIIPLSQWQPETAGAASILEHHQRLGSLARSHRNGNKVHPGSFHLQVVLANLGRKHCQIRLRVHITIGAAFQNGRRKEHAVRYVAASAE